MIQENEPSELRGVPELTTVGQLRALLKDFDDDTKLIIAPLPDIDGWTSRLLNAIGDLNNAPDGGSDGTKVLYVGEASTHMDEVDFTPYTEAQRG